MHLRFTVTLGRACVRCGATARSTQTPTHRRYADLGRSRRVLCGRASPGELINADVRERDGYAVGLETGKCFGFAAALPSRRKCTRLHRRPLRLLRSFRRQYRDQGWRQPHRLVRPPLECRDVWIGTRRPTSARLYGIDNLYYEFPEVTRVDLSGTRFRIEREELWDGLGLGGTYGWGRNTYAL